MISSLELAKLCGVSQGTVDRALHDRPGISAKTRARILALAEQHGYAPNPAARELMGLAVSSMVGLLLPDWTMRAPFFMDVAGEMSQHLRHEGLGLSLWPTAPGPAAMRTAFIDLAARRLRAVALMLPPDGLDLPAAMLRRQPVLSLLLPCASPGVVNLMPDDRAIGLTATRHLVELGHQRIAYLHGPRPGHRSSLERLAGYEAALTAAKLSSSVYWDEADAADLIQRLRSQRITAVFCHNDPTALVLIRRLRADGLAVPGDVSVIGVDRSPVLTWIDPSITSVPYPFAGIAAQVVATVLERPLPPLPEPTVAAGSTTGRWPV